MRQGVWGRRTVVIDMVWRDWDCGFLMDVPWLGMGETSHYVSHVGVYCMLAIILLYRNGE
jgi:hypothetical protein